MVLASDGDRTSEVHLLPSRCRLTRECGCRKVRAAARPQFGYVGARVCAGLVESDSENSSIDIGAKFYTELNRAGVAAVDNRRDSSA